MTEAETHKPQCLQNRRWLGVSLLALAVSAAICVDCRLRSADDDKTPLRLLRSEDPGRRKLGAWLTVEQRSGPALSFIVRQLELDREPVADVRESYVYALGQLGSEARFEMVARLIRDDPSGYVRQAAWLAAARIDAGRLRAIAEESVDRLGGAPVSPDDAWDQIGLCNACLRIGDMRGVPALLHWARNGDPDQQLVTCGALRKGLAPLLEAAGRWPLGVEVPEGQIWPPELLDEIRRRCAGLDLQAIADDTRPHLEAAKRVQRDARRLTSARNWIVRILSFL